MSRALRGLSQVVKKFLSVSVVKNKNITIVTVSTNSLPQHFFKSKIQSYEKRVEI